MSEWRPIETAPKDGTLILVYDEDGGEVTMASYSQVHWCWIDCITATDGEVAYEQNYITWTLVELRCYAPTYWMPLPEPPG